VAEFRSQRTDLPPVPADVFCPDCGYDLHGLTGARCPECGFDLETVRARAPQIPWARRREIGW
jgi:rubredoxin